MSPSGGSLLEGRDLAKAFGATQALRGASLAIEPGEMVAVMGPSGSGKSTLLHCLAGIIRPDTGQVILDGARIDHLSVGARTTLRRREFGFVFQFGQLIPELAVRENVMLPLLLDRIDRRSARRDADAWLERLGIGDVGGRLPGQVSGGQGQRAAIARALIGGPRVLFADEPTGALDSIHGDQVMQLLGELSRESGAAVVLVTHEARVAAHADREVFVRDGRTPEGVSVG